MAAWQADFDVVLPAAGLPADYRRRLSEILPPCSSWAEDLEVWGTEDGDRIDVFSAASQSPEVFARFDMRRWRPSLYDAFLRFVGSADARIQAAESKAAIPAATEEFARALRGSRAARFVQDPETYLRSLQDDPVATQQAWHLDEVASYWDAVAGRYLELFRHELRGKPYDLAVLERFAASLEPGARVCDVGCGPCGHVTRVLADHELEVVGTDISTECIALARGEQPALRFDVMDMAALAFGDEALDGLVAYYSLHYQPKARVRSTLREFARVLRPHGRLLVVAKEGAGEGWIADPLGSGRSVFWCAFSGDELRQLIEECGFDVLDCDTRVPLADEIATRRVYLSAERNAAPVG